jgi:hypothetical protein
MNLNHVETSKTVSNYYVLNENFRMYSFLCSSICWSWNYMSLAGYVAAVVQYNGYIPVYSLIFPQEYITLS